MTGGYYHQLESNILRLFSKLNHISLLTRERAGCKVLSSSFSKIQRFIPSPVIDMFFSVSETSFASSFVSLMFSIAGHIPDLPWQSFLWTLSSELANIKKALATFCECTKCLYFASSIFSSSLHFLLEVVPEIEENSTKFWFSISRKRWIASRVFHFYTLTSWMRISFSIYVIQSRR